MAIVGVGLIGGSIGLAVRKRGLAGRVVGIGRRQTSLDKALACGAIDEASTELASGADGADMVVVATPLDRVAPSVRAAAAAGAQRLTDAGSTKANICRDVGSDLSDRFVGSHPLAGDHRTGPEHARADLFAGRTVVVTPTAESPADLVEQISQFWTDLGAKIVRMSPVDHDQALAATSHLPHLTSAALAAATPEQWLSLAATGWADATRIAAGDPALWAQICASNRGGLLEALDRFDRSLSEFRTAVENEDWEHVEHLFNTAKRMRDALGD